MATKKITKTTTKDKSNKGFLKSLIENVTENVAEGATYVAEGASFVTEKFKETTAKAYVASAELVEEANEKIHHFTDKQALNKEKHKLEAAQETLTFKFGELTLAHYLKNDSLHKTFLNTKAIDNLVLEYKANQKLLLKVEKQLIKLENE
ncbi:hypothetical protein [Mariniflexile sp.]|uniref:hypothetical protein n=1 Tax=Mariniflexile sp. TaxID=1979402 RepID=UPI003569CF61